MKLVMLSLGPSFASSKSCRMADYRALRTTEKGKEAIQWPKLSALCAGTTRLCRPGYARDFCGCWARAPNGRV